MILEAAKERAESLLKAHLTPAQLATYLDDGWFRVIGSLGGVFTVTNVRLKGIRGDSGSGHTFSILYRDQQYCVIPRGSSGMPWADTLLAQKLHIESREDYYTITRGIYLDEGFSGHPSIRLVNEKLVIE